MENYVSTKDTSLNLLDKLSIKKKEKTPPINIFKKLSYFD